MARLNRCRKCHGKTDLFLCKLCVDQLVQLLEEIPWLLDELATTIMRQDKLTSGGAPNNRPAELTVINVDASALAAETFQILTGIVRSMTSVVGPYRPPASVPNHFCGPLRPAWRRLPVNYRPRPAELILWLIRHRSAIARHPKAGRMYDQVEDLVGDYAHDGRLVVAINRTDRAYYGPCTNLVGRDRHGRPRACGADLYAPRESRDVTCRICGYTVAAQRQLRSTIRARDLVTEPQLLEALDDLGEHVSRVRLYDWIRAGRLQPRGWVHNGTIVAQRVRRGDPRVFSLSQARDLRLRDDAKPKEKIG